MYNTLYLYDTGLKVTFNLFKYIHKQRSHSTHSDISDLVAGEPAQHLYNCGKHSRLVLFKTGKGQNDKNQNNP